MNSSVQPTQQTLSSNDRVVDIVLHQDDLNWKELLYDLVRQENMNPWDINISRLAQRFLELLSSLKETDFRISGKMVLTSSLLLKLKSDDLMNQGLQGLDDLISGTVEESFEDTLDDSFEFEQTDIKQFLNDEKKLVPRTPQPRERKVSVFDLVNALETALESDVKRKVVRARNSTEQEPRPSGKPSFDLSQRMQTIQGQLTSLFKKSKTSVTFDALVPSEPSKVDVVSTFLPLLHLETQRKVDLSQEEHFGPIGVTIFNKRL